MKHLLTLTALLISSLAMGQWPSLPYNPDDNADGLIGVVDLQGLLANYGNEFASAIVSEDGESAIVYMGGLGYPQCSAACRDLPGFWQVADLDDLGPVISTMDGNSYTWLRIERPDIQNGGIGSDIGVAPTFYYQGANDGQVRYRASILAGYRCYCAAKQLPRVEFYKCVGNGSDAVEECVNCVSTKLSEGWQLLPPGGSSVVQDLWRWVE